VLGKLVAMETKRPGKDLTKIQEYERKRILKSGGICERIDSLDQAKALIERVRNGEL
jgi:copper homeostasis protein CutC